MMTEFQKELVLLGVCLSFFFVCSNYAVIVQNESVTIAQIIQTVRTLFNG